MVREDSEGRRLVYGSAPNVNTLLQAEHTTLSPRRFNATVRIETKHSRIIYAALKPDIDHSIEGRVSADMKLVDKAIIINISSDDLSHLRANLNSYLRLAKTAVSCLDLTL